MSTINMDAVTSARPWETVNASPMSSATQNGQPQLPSISAMTAGVTASGQEQSPSYTLSSNAQERDSGNWSMPPSTRKFTFHSFTPFARRRATDFILLGCSPGLQTCYP